MFVRLCGWRLKTLCWWWMTATSACSHATSVSWHDHYFHNPLSCFDTSLSFRIVVVLLGDPCLPFVLQLFTKQHFIALFSNLSSSCSTSFSILLSFRLLPTGEMNPWADLTPGMPPSSTRATQKPKTSPHPHQSGKQDMMQGNWRDRK